MKLVLARRAALACAFSVTAIAAAATAQQPAPHAPAPSPQQIYSAHCAACHGAHLEGGAGPALKGGAIASEKTADLYTAIKTTMPLDAPGSLTDGEYKALAGWLKAESAHQ